MLKKIAALALAVGAVLAAAPAVAQKTIRVGVIQPLSGGQSPYGRETQPVVDYMIKAINESGGIKSMGGAKLEIVLADTASQSAQAAREAIRLITQEKVDVLIGALLTNDMLAITRAVEDNRTPTISFLAGGSKTKYAFTLGFAYDDGYAASMADFIRFLKEKSSIPVQRVALAYANYEGGQQINKFLKERITAMGLDVVTEVALDVKGQDFMGPLLKIKAEKPDVVVGLMLQNQTVNLFQARYQLKYFDSIFVGSIINADMKLKRDLGPEVADAVLPRGVFGMAFYSPTAKLPAVQALADELIHKAGMGDHFGQLAIPAAQAIRVLQRALEAAGTTESEALTAAIANTSIPAEAPDLYFPLPQGLRFGEDRLVKNLRSLITQWSDPPSVEPVVVYPAEIASAKPRK